jgi:hypothetical protein
MPLQEESNRRFVLGAPNTREEQVLAGFDSVLEGFKELAVSFENPDVDLARPDSPTKELLGAPHAPRLDVHLDSG